MMNTICILTGGPMRKISVGGKIYDFEMHPYCGPTLLNKRGDPIDLRKHPQSFLHAASLWSQQGQKIEDGLCVWYHEPKEIKKHLGGRHWEITGCEPPVRGN
jgi:hypothetical protein